MIVKILCRNALQPAFSKLYLLALTGMNYGNANTLEYNYTGEQWLMQYIKRKTGLNNEFIFFDAGANAGSYSVAITNLFGWQKITVYAFEPSLQTFNLLLKHTAGIGNIHCFNVGLGSKEETVKIYSSYEGSGSATIYNSGLDNYSFNKKLAEEITLVTIDGFCTSHSIEKIDFIKIDVEGHELYVLNGASHMIEQNNIRFIQFEFGSFNVYSRTFFKDFWNLLSPKYILYRIITNGLLELKSYNENLEIFRTSNFLAERRA